MPCDLAHIPPGYHKPTPALIRKVEAAVAGVRVPRTLLCAVILEESQFRPGLRGRYHAGNSRTFARSYAKWKNRKIPGGRGLTWGQMFRAEEWSPRGLMQLMPYHLVGKSRGVRAGAPLAELLDVVPNAYHGAKLLADAHLEHGDWHRALRVYNDSARYVRRVIHLAQRMGWRDERENV